MALSSIGSVGSNPGVFKQPVYGQTYGVYDAPRSDEAQDFQLKQQSIADRMNAAFSGGGGRSGGGGGGGSPPVTQTPSGTLWDPSYGGRFIESPDLHLQQQAENAKEQRFNTVWGGLSGLLGRTTNPITIGGDSGTGPEITVGGVYNPQTVNQQVNATRAKNDRSAATKSRDAVADATGRGFGSQSPLLAALQGQIWGQNVATNTEAERAIRQTAAEQNSQQLLSTQQAREAQYASRQQEQIARAQPYFQTQNALIAALAGLA